VWIVNIGERRIEVFDKMPGPDELGGTTYTAGQTTPPIAGVRVDVAALLGDLPSDDGSATMAGRG
jgi:hypothetical protein